MSKKIECVIKMGSDHELRVSADTMAGIVKEIAEWQDLEDHLSTLDQMNKLTPEKEIAAQESGWYIPKGDVHVKTR